MASASSITSGLEASSVKESPSGVSRPAAGAIVSDALATGVMFALVMTVVQRLLGFARGILFCRLMTPEELGQFSLLTGALMLLAPLAVLGLPGTFGRFAQHYRQTGQLHSYLSRVGRVSMVMTAALAATMFGFPDWFSWLLLGERGHVELIRLAAGCILAVSWCNYLTSLVEALQQVRLASLMRFVSSIVFTLGGIGLLSWMTERTGAAVLAFGFSSLCGAVPAWWYLRRRRRALAASNRSLPGSELWPRVLPFAAWWWFSNLLHNSYELADRYLLIWFSGMGAAEIQAAAGQLHSAKVLPLLVVNVAGMLSGMLLPFVTAALVRGEPEQACRQLNWTLKLSGLALVAINFSILCVAPLLFGSFLQGKYAEGLELLPLSVASCSWLCLLTISQDWLWAQERGRMAVAGLVFGLAVTAALGCLLIPPLGVSGAVWATLAGNVAGLLSIAWCNQRTKCTHDRGVWLALASPLLILGGPLLAASSVLLMLYLVLSTNAYFGRSERAELEHRLQTLLERFRR